MAESILINKLADAINILFDTYYEKSKPVSKSTKDEIVQNLIEVYLLIPDHAYYAFKLLLKQILNDQAINELIIHKKQYTASDEKHQSIVKPLTELLSQVSKTPPRQYLQELKQKVANAKPWRMKETDYEQVLAILEIIHAVSRNSIVEEQAYKLACLFGHPKHVIAYLKYFSEKYQPDPESLLHDACLFSLPHGEYDAEIWRLLCIKHYREEDFINCLANADAIEKQIKIRAGLPRVNDKDIEKIEEKIIGKQKINQKIDKLQIQLVQAFHGLSFNENLRFSISTR